MQFGHNKSHEQTVLQKIIETDYFLPNDFVTMLPAKYADGWTKCEGEEVKIKSTKIQNGGKSKRSEINIMVSTELDPMNQRNVE